MIESTSFYNSLIIKRKIKKWRFCLTLIHLQESIQVQPLDVLCNFQVSSCIDLKRLQPDLSTSCSPFQF